MPNCLVADIYHGDRVSSFKKAQQSGLAGVIHKATTGATGKDPKYASRRSAALNAGLLWGAYHWGTNSNVDRQLANFLSTAEPDERTLVALDFEPDNPRTMELDQAREFLEKISIKLGRKAVLYSGSLIKDRLGNRTNAFFGSHRLWLAQYGDNPTVQRSWSRYWLWQYTDGIHGPAPRTVPGIPGNSRGQLDCNSFEGTAARLAAGWAS